MGNMSYDGNILLNVKTLQFGLFYKTKKSFFPWWRFVAKPWYVCLFVLHGRLSPVEISTLFWLAWLRDTASCSQQHWLALKGITVHSRALVLFSINV